MIIIFVCIVHVVKAVLMCVNYVALLLNSDVDFC